MDTAEFNTIPPLSIAPHDSIAIDPDWSTLTPIESVNTHNIASDIRLAPLTYSWAQRLELRAKRVLDVVGASLGLLALAPVLLLVALLIQRDSPGPILFKQRRLGRRGVPFWILKFRTMRADAEQRLAELETRNESARGVLFKMTDDPRVTRLGRFLRKTNLDELPQLWNVMRGEMSLVGPRPFQLRDSERLKAHDPESFARRLEFPPGLTGAWQVGRKSPTDSDRLLDLDLDYINNWTLGQDVWLIYRTVFVMLAGFRSRADASVDRGAKEQPVVLPATQEA